jgi:hypothetical protein
MLICDKCHQVQPKNVSLKVEKTHSLVDLFFSNANEYEHDGCGGEIVQAEKCNICRKLIPSNGYGICDSCAKQNFTLENALSLGNEYKKQIEINGFLAFVFDKCIDEIEDIIIKNITTDTAEMKEALQKDITNFCEQDMDLFKEWLNLKWNTER